MIMYECSLLNRNFLWYLIYLLYSTRPSRTTLLQPLLFFHFFSNSLCILTNALNPFNPLSLLIHISTLQYPLHDLTRIHTRKIMPSYLAVDTHLLWGGIRIIGERHEARGAVVDGIGDTPGGRCEVGPGRSEGCAEYHRIYVLRGRLENPHLKLACWRLTLHCKTQRPRS